MALLDEVKVVLRIAATAYDQEVLDLIEAAKMELVISGVSETVAADETNSLIRRAVMLYLKAEFGMDNPDAERYMRSFRALATHLSLSDGYRAEDET